MEIWKEIPKTDYSISNQGRVYNRKTKRFIAEEKMKFGYRRVNIHGKKKLIHRLVLEAFNPVINAELEVNHIDGDKGNNNIDNLEWVTRKQNMIHAFETGLDKGLKGGMNGHSKKVAMINDGMIVKTFDSMAEAGEYIGTTSGNIWNACNKGIKAKGYHWQYV